MDEDILAQEATDSATQSASAEQLRHASHRDMRRRLVSLLEERRTDLDAGPMLLDAAVYTDANRFEAERRELFIKRPILAALSRDLPEPGDTVVFDDLGPSILLVRNAQGRVNAFLNMCSHRGAKLVQECAAKRRMSCPFHGWTFDLDGELVGIPGQEGFDGIDKATRRLIRVPVVEWHGLVFVKADPDGEPIDVEAHLGSMASELIGLELADAEPVKSSCFDVSSNWKYALDTYCESYHLATVHARTIGTQSISNVMAYRQLDGHHRIGFPRAELLALVDKPESDWPSVVHYGGLYYIFPNVVIQVNLTRTGDPFYGVSRLFPGTSVDSCRTRRTTYKPHYASADADVAAWVEAHDFGDLLIEKEDYPIVAAAQRNLEHTRDFQVVLGANEIALQHIHRRIDALLRDAGEPRSSNEPR